MEIPAEEGLPLERIDTLDVRLIPEVQYKSSYEALARDHINNIQ